VTRAAVLALAVGLITAACESSDSRPDPNATPVLPTNGVLTVRGSEWKFEPAAIEVEAGQEVDITFENAGEIVHNLKVDDIEADVIESSEDGEVFVEAEAGDSATLVFSPAEAGSYTYYCDVPDHRDLGMEGELVVVGAP
jgi:plastocyanin